MTNRRLLAAFALAAGLAASPSSVGATGLEVRLGGFVPRAKSILFDDSVTLYSVEKKDFAGAFGGIEFTQNLHRNIELALAVEGYGTEKPTFYRDFTRPSGREIEQTLRLVIVPASAIVRLVPGGRYRKVTPYAGVGVAAMFWQYEEFGDFIDFGDRGRPVIFDSFKSNGVKPGLVLNAGIRYRLNEDFELTADVRNFAARQRMKGDFAPNEIDLSGTAATLGFRITF